MGRLRLVVAALLLTALGAVACSDLVVGDSLVVLSAVATDPTGATGYTSDGVTLRGFVGRAPCDYVSFMNDDFNKYRPKRVSFAWSGNAGTPCMKDRYGKSLTGAAMVLKYHDDLVALTKFFASKGVGVIYSAPVCVSPEYAIGMNGNPAIRSMERRLAASFAAQHYHVAYSEYAALQVCPGWTYVPEYRTIDGLHLTTLGGQVYAAALRIESKQTRIP